MAGVPHNACLGLALQVLEKLPTIPIDLNYHMPIPMMLAYAPKSYAYQTWHEDGGGTSALSGDARASCILSQRLEWLALGEGADDNSPDSVHCLLILPVQQHPFPKGAFCPSAIPSQRVFLCSAGEVDPT